MWGQLPTVPTVSTSASALKVTLAGGCVARGINEAFSVLYWPMDTGGLAKMSICVWYVHNKCGDLLGHAQQLGNWPEKQSLLSLGSELICGT